MNPLKLPKWAKKSSKQPVPRGRWETVDSGVEKVAKAPRAPYRTRKEEAAYQASIAEAIITVEVAGIRGHERGTHKLAYSAGWNLGMYLSQIGLKMAATKNAVYDLSILEQGRVRLTHVPQPGVTISLGPVNYSPMSQWQRGQRDAEFKPGPKVEDVDMSYRPNGEPRRERLESIDSLEIDQI